MDENGNQLRDNWRSDRHIIQFNNEFFEYVSHLFANEENSEGSLAEIAEIYSDVSQTIHANREKKGVADGQVSFEILDAAKNEDYQEKVAARLPELVISLEQRGFEAKDILILCRKREQCHLCAQALMEYQSTHPDSPYNMDIITQEALLLCKQPIIKALIAAMQFLHEPKSAYFKAIAGICWEALSTDSTTAAVTNYFKTRRCPDFESLLNMPLYETVERLIAMLPAEARQATSFIQAFCDVVLAYCTKEGPSLGGFLYWWQQYGQGCSVTTPSMQNAIRIMTIHQSKGLDGEAVIIPFAQDSVDLKAKNTDILWCTPSGQFAHTDLVLPISISKSTLPHSIFAADYAKERMRAIIDNLNTIYVAFTRARHTMIMLSPKPGKTDNYDLQCLLNKFFTEKWKEGNEKFVVNEEQIELDRQRKVAEKAALLQNSSDNGSTDRSLIETHETPMPRIKETEYTPAADSAAARGTTLHNAFSAIVDRTQIESPIRRLFTSGKAILQGFDSIDQVIEKVNQAIAANPKAKEWFGESNRVLNERDIINSTTHTRRPDRIVFTPDNRVIVIDYKTGDVHNKKYQRQVSLYMSLLADMGFSHIEGYLWYIETGQIVPVNR